MIDMNTPWGPVTRTVLSVSIIYAVIFWIYALTDKDGFLFLDYVNLPFHEFGHLLFGIFGETIGAWGGTLFQLLIPLVIFMNFFIKKEVPGAALSIFWFGENLLNISVYIADARRMLLPLVGGGEHDWNFILAGIGLLRYDTTIAGIIKAAGWLIMISSIVWLLIMYFRNQSETSY